MPPFDANEYITHVSTWGLLFIGCLLLSLFIISAIASYRDHIVQLMMKLTKSQEEKDNLIQQQQKALAEIKTLRSIIPICTSCQNIREDEGFWENAETYIKKHTDVQFSHGLCPECGENIYGDVWSEAQGLDKLEQNNTLIKRKTALPHGFTQPSVVP